MAELTINTADIAAALRKNLEDFKPDVSTAQVGRITEVGDGIATVAGLPDAAVNELLEFESGAVGLALNLDEDSIGCVVLGDASGVKEGQTVKATGRILSVPVGDGQRELIIGDRKTGKTTIAVDTIINQRGLGVKCIYVAIGQKESTVANTVSTLEEHGAMDYTVVVVAGASDPSPFKYLAPYAGCAMGQHWMETGEHALAVYDDLSKQAEAYRQISLLLRRPPGREAYPGDVFYLHSRLLERAAKLSDENGGGSLTALPVIETKAGDISAYIPTNVISITDGQIYLQEDLFFAGVRPAMNVGISVSRVGGNAQIKGMKQVSGRLRGDLAQFRELEAFASFGSELDKVSQAQLDRGYRLVELLKQPLNSPMPVEEQVVSLYAGTRGHLDDVPVAQVRRYEAELLEWFGTRHRDALDAIRTGGDIADVAAFEMAIKDFAEQFSWEEAADEVAAGAQAGPAPGAATPDGAEAAADSAEDGGASEVSE